MTRLPADTAPRLSTMTRLEKRFVNSPRKGQAVARKLEELMGYAAPAPGARYLDVGCGNGAATIEVADAYRLDATGVDIDPGQIALAHAGGGTTRFQEADATRLPFPDGAFDVVSSSKATHHMPAWRDALAEMARVLRPGGHLVYTDLTLPRALALLVRLLSRHELPTRAALDTTIESLGLAVVHRRVTRAGYDAVLRRPGRAEHGVID